MQKSTTSWMTKPNKVLFPLSGITKADLALHYEHVAPLMIPLIKYHPLAMQRFPDGIEHEGFYQKDIPEYFPDWIDRVSIENKDGSTTTYAMGQNKKTLVYLAYQACITLHELLSKSDKLHYPDRMIFDLDPGQGVTFALIKKTALAIKELLDKNRITSFAMTTGSRGIHVVVPLRRLYTFEYTHTYAQRIGQLLVQEYPHMLTVSMSKEERKGKIFIDFIRNTFGHHAVAPYAVRAHEYAPVATPVDWAEVEKPTLESQSYTIQNIQKRIKKVGNVWSDFLKIKNRLPSTLKSTF